MFEEFRKIQLMKKAEEEKKERLKIEQQRREEAQLQQKMEQLSVGYQPPAAFNNKYPDPEFYQY